MKPGVARGTSLEVIVNQAGVDGTAAIISHMGCEEQEMDMRGFQNLTLLGLSDSLVTTLSPR